MKFDFDLKFSLSLLQCVFEERYSEQKEEKNYYKLFLFCLQF
jgi:hypothetical protein